MERVAGQDNRHWVESEEKARQRVEQVKSLKEQACKGGLRFKAYLTADLAEWILDMVENGVFVDPSEAVFVFMQQAKDIDPYDDLKEEILRRRLDQGIKDVDEGRTSSMEEVRERIDQYAKNKTEPAVWNKIAQETS